MLRFLLDTNTCIFIIKYKPPQVRERFSILAPNDLGISAVTEAELLYGAHKSERPEQNLAAVLAFASLVRVVPFDSRVTDEYGRLRAHLSRQGTPIGPLDTLIAATALALRVPLVTNNTREFARVPGLTIEDWIR